MRATDRNILTIGHSTHPLEAFVALLRRHQVNAVADVRAAPYSRFNPQFNREPLAGDLAAHGIEYVFLGLELGGRSDDPSFYDKGRIRYDRLGGTPSFQRGLDRVMRGAVSHRIALMCAEREPLECHRALLVAPALEARGVTVSHILADGRLETHADAMDRLLAMHDDPRQGALFVWSGERVERAIARQAERFAHRDETLAAADSPAGGRDAEQEP